MNNCKTCKYWKQDRGIWTATGWTRMWEEDGHCYCDIERVGRNGKEPACRYYDNGKDKPERIEQ